MAPAVAATEPSRSLSTCARAPRSFSELVPERMRNAARFAMPPATATANINLPLICAGEMNRCAASNTTATVIASSNSPLV